MMAEYVVTIPYTEPAFDARRGRAQPRRVTAIFKLVAASPAEAVELARREFDEIAEASAVGWRRLVQEDEIKVA